MFLRGNCWHYDFTIGKKRYRGSTGFRKNEKKKAIQAEEKIRVQAREKYSIELIWRQTKRRIISECELPVEASAIWKTFLKQTSCHAGSHRMKIYKSRLEKFCFWMREKHPEILTVSSILSSHAREWMNHLCSLSGANSTKNDYLTALKMIFSTLRKYDGIIEDPFAGIKKLPASQISREAFSLEELALIGRHAKGWIYSLCLTALSTGLREGDICLLKRSCVNLQSGWISIPHTRKTGAPVDIPILPGLKRHLLEKMTEENFSEYVFPELAERYLSSPWQIGRSVKKFFQMIGINGTNTEVKSYKIRLSSKDIHSFRHTFIYLAACHGIPFPVVQAIVGHTSPDMTRRYMDHAGREEKKRCLDRLPEYLTGGNGEKRKTLAEERLAGIIRKLSPDNIERNKKRFLELLKKKSALF